MEAVSVQAQAKLWCPLTAVSARSQLHMSNIQLLIACFQVCMGAVLPSSFLTHLLRNTHEFNFLVIRQHVR